MIKPLQNTCKYQYAFTETGFVMDLGLKGKTALVTGGAKGIGAGICSVLAGEGCNLVINYRSDENQAQCFAEKLIEENAIQAKAIRADVSKEEEAAELFEDALLNFGQVDILINNAAGGYQPNAFQNISSKEWQMAGEGLLNSAFYMSRLFLEYCLAEKKGGHIVNLLSKSAILSSSVNNLAYVAYKGALTSLTRGMAKEFISHGIYVNGIVPGYVKTERRHTEGDERTERVKKLLPSGQFAKPHEIGNVAAILCSPCFSQMIGAVVDCTGGTLI